RRGARPTGDPGSRASQERAVEVGQLPGEALARAQLGHPPAPLRPDPLSRGDRDRHHSFSTFTRNALNSGVRAFASPTKGVSALASQYLPLPGSLSADRPTYPQWIGMPIW